VLPVAAHFYYRRNCGIVGILTSFLSESIKMTPATSQPASLASQHDPKPISTDQFWHSDDYTEIRTGTIVHFLTKMQAAGIKLIHQAHIDGRLDLPGDSILQKIGSECTRMGQLYQFSSVWKTVLIWPFRRGYYSLSPFVELK